jgi:hypothetical protein
VGELRRSQGQQRHLHPHQSQINQPPWHHLRCRREMRYWACWRASRFRDFEISGRRSHGGAKARRKQREETTTGHKQRGSSQFPGVLVGPPHVRKCHQMSSKEHIQLGWAVRWPVLSTPLGHPAAGRCVRVVPVLPLLLCTRPARPRPSIGGQSPTPAPCQLPWSPPRGWCSRVR